MPAKEVYADHTFEAAAASAGARVIAMWQVKAPNGAANVAWLECLMVNGVLVIVQTNRDGSWAIFAQCGVAPHGQTVVDALKLCGVSHV